MSLVKFLPAWFHAIADYAVAALLIAVPLIAGGSDEAVATGVVVGVVVAIVSMLTRYPLGVSKSLPFPIHGAIEFVVAILLIILPWLANFSAGVHSRNFFLAIGMLVLIIWILTDYRSRRSAGRATDPEATVR